MSDLIEEGCQAIIRGSRFNDGKIVTVGTYIGSVPNWNSINLWNVDKEIQGFSKSGGCTIAHHVDERFLKRYDYDGDLVENLEGFVLEDIFKPAVEEAL